MTPILKFSLLGLGAASVGGGSYVCWSNRDSIKEFLWGSSEVVDTPASPSGTGSESASTGASVAIEGPAASVTSSSSSSGTGSGAGGASGSSVISPTIQAPAGGGVPPQQQPRQENADRGAVDTGTPSREPGQTAEDGRTSEDSGSRDPGTSGPTVEIPAGVDVGAGRQGQGGNGLAANGGLPQQQQNQEHSDSNVQGPREGSSGTIQSPLVPSRQGATEIGAGGSADPSSSGQPGLLQPQQQDQVQGAQSPAGTSGESQRTVDGTNPVTTNTNTPREGQISGPVTGSGGGVNTSPAPIAISTGGVETQTTDGASGQGGSPSLPSPEASGSENLDVRSTSSGTGKVQGGSGSPAASGEGNGASGPDGAILPGVGGTGAQEPSGGVNGSNPSGLGGGGASSSEGTPSLPTNDSSDGTTLPGSGVPGTTGPAVETPTALPNTDESSRTADPNASSDGGTPTPALVTGGSTLQETAGPGAASLPVSGTPGPQGQDGAGNVANSPSSGSSDGISGAGRSESGEQGSTGGGSASNPAGSDDRSSLPEDGNSGTGPENAAGGGGASTLEESPTLPGSGATGTPGAAGGSERCTER